MMTHGIKKNSIKNLLDGIIEKDKYFQTTIQKFLHFNKYLKIAKNNLNTMVILLMKIFLNIIREKIYHIIIKNKH